MCLGFWDYHFSDARNLLKQMFSFCKIILWVGPKHSGKTTAAARLAEKAKKDGFRVAGILEPSIYKNEKLAGFDIVDLNSRKRTILARRKKDNELFSFTSKGLRLGRAALSKKAAGEADLIIVDEYGLLELAGKGWRKCVDKLAFSTTAFLILVVRKELAGRIKKLYKNFIIQQFNTANKNSVNKILLMLKENKKIYNEIKKYSRKNQISCESCFRIASELNVPLKMVGRICDDKKIKICFCQLGCFK